MNSPLRVGRYDIPDQLTAAEVREIAGRFDGDASGGNDNVTALFVAGPEFGGRLRLTGRAAFLLGMGARR